MLTRLVKLISNASWKDASVMARMQMVMLDAIGAKGWEGVCGRCGWVGEGRGGYKRDKYPGTRRVLVSVYEGIIVFTMDKEKNAK